MSGLDEQEAHVARLREQEATAAARVCQSLAARDEAQRALTLAMDAWRSTRMRHSNALDDLAAAKVRSLAAKRAAATRKARKR